MKKELVILLLILSLISGCTGVDTILDDKSVGGVIMCGVDYRCGFIDSICPEDYGADCKIFDKDCS